MVKKVEKVERMNDEGTHGRLGTEGNVDFYNKTISLLTAIFKQPIKAAASVELQ